MILASCTAPHEARAVVLDLILESPASHRYIFPGFFSFLIFGIVVGEEPQNGFPFEQIAAEEGAPDAENGAAPDVSFSPRQMLPAQRKSLDDRLHDYWCKTIQLLVKAPSLVIVYNS